MITIPDAPSPPVDETPSARAAPPPPPPPAKIDAALNVAAAFPSEFTSSTAPPADADCQLRHFRLCRHHLHHHHIHN